MIENNRFYWSVLKTRSVTVSVRPREGIRGVAFSVNKIIDIGSGRQTVFLDHLEHPDQKAASARRSGVNNELAIPFKMGNLDFVYISRRTPAIRDISVLISELYKNAKIERIVPEVLCPGDILVFRQDEQEQKIKMVDALRVMYPASEAGRGVNVL
ncbi:MAG: hypothetical protein KJ017_10985 [Alphaproteobacteria bacterium]|nr:hypothetical protein [Alphaproteobacteria bacterium]